MAYECIFQRFRLNETLLFNNSQIIVVKCENVVQRSSFGKGFLEVGPGDIEDLQTEGVLYLLHKELHSVQQQTRLVQKASKSCETK